MTIILILILVTFLSGLYFCMNYSSSKAIEGLTNNSNGQPRCPNILLQKNAKFYLYNSDVAMVPGVNPIEFDNLEDYTEFIEWQRSKGIRCPVLYLQNMIDAQGESVYKIRPNVLEPQGGLPPTNTTIPTILTGFKTFPTAPNPTLLVDATRNDYPYNTNSMPGYDETDFYVGSTTPLDKMQNEVEENMLYSPNPMDDNWGGQNYTQSLVDRGYYVGNEVEIAIP
jgi:hypothetical protein